MKLVGRIICSILLSITILFSLVFAFIELRSLVAGDYSLMNNVTISFVTYLFRGLYFVILASFSIFLLGIYLKDKEVAFISSEQLIDNTVDRLFVTRDRVRGKDDRIARVDINDAVGSKCHT